METVEILRLVAATGCGIQIGGFMLLSLFHSPLFKAWPETKADIHRRYDIELSLRLII